AARDHDDLPLEFRHPALPSIRPCHIILGTSEAARKQTMKTIFIDCNDQLDAVFARVHRADDPAIVVNTKPFERTALPRVLAGYEISVDANSYRPTELVARCPSLKHIVFLGTGASSYVDVPALNGLGITVHTIKGYGDIAVAEHAIALMFACARELARM